MSKNGMKTHVFAVMDEPYCVWEHPLDQHNVDFLSGIDTEYFRFAADTLNASAQSSDDQRRAATLLRSVYHHAMETFFSLIGAALQAPHCVYGWLTQCKTDALRTLVEQISEEKFVSPHVMKDDTVSWTSIATWIFGNSDTDQDERIRAIERFADLWAKSAEIFLRQESIDEYNSLKHGFRVELGGFHLEMKVESPEASEFPTKHLPLGGSKYGSSYFRLGRVGGNERANRSLLPQHHRINWSVEQTRSLLVLLGVSIHNVIGFLKVLNGTPGNSVKLHCPTNDQFHEPWSHSVELLSMNIDRTVPNWAVRSTSRQELNEHLTKRRKRRTVQ